MVNEWLISSPREGNQPAAIRRVSSWINGVAKYAIDTRMEARPPLRTKKTDQVLAVCGQNLLVYRACKTQIFVPMACLELGEDLLDRVEVGAVRPPL
jgi:hypothetical protein